MKTLLALALLGVAGLSASLHAQTYRFEVPLDGAQEFPGPGDPDGSGLAILFLDAAANSVIWDITVQDIDLPISGDHIHRAPAGVSGPVVVNFGGALSGGPIVDPDVALILADPSQYYVNVHNTAYLAGAIRGQLGEGILVPEASTVTAGVVVALFGLGAWWRRRPSRALSC